MLDSCGFAWMSPGLLLAGSLLDSLAEAWLFVLAYVAFAQLEATRRPIVAMGACLGAYLLQPWANALAPTVAVIANAACFAALFLCVRALVARPLRQAQRSEPQAEMAVANPQSFLPTGHLLFVAIFGLTPRESEVFALLAQGRTVGGYPREVGHLAEHGALPYQEHLRQAGGAFPARAYRCGGSLRFRIDLLTRKKLCRVCWLCSVSPVVPQGLNWANGDRWAQLPVCHLCKSGSNTQGCIFWLDLYRLAAHFFLICIGFVL